MEEKVVKPVQKEIGDVGVLTIYWDNIHYGVNDLESEIKILVALARKCKELNVKFGSGKVGVETLDMLGFELNKDTLRPVRKALRKIEEAPSPKNKKELRSWSGKTNYYKVLVPGYAVLAAPLTDLLGKNQFEWTEIMQEHFDKLMRLSRVYLEKPALRMSMQVTRDWELF